MIKRLSNDESLPWHLLLEADPEKELVEEYLSESIILGYQSKILNRITGVLVLKKQQLDLYEIMNVSVDEVEQGRGIGTLLIKNALAAVSNETEGNCRVQVKTGDTSKPALALYKKNGFEIKEVVENYFIENYSEPIFEEGVLLKNQVILEKMV
ncbi:GNAT family N-acetyltransferase [Vagococcus sp. PNs007]|uniref:GNAT family N-acetyltransferase n=1 Tax=Vagococcus proximus TaxID=2991417 RepID=A0ABT5X379_9ENTE|nr:GNAT family N-acetyltransferase [Vagococcus proximus]MDF0480372.1 GNAT family N-acetyltransferase [Vagococcus proximus]